MSLDNKIHIIIINIIIIIIIIIISVLMLLLLYMNVAHKLCTSSLYKEMWSAHNRQSINTYIMYIDTTSKLVPIGTEMHVSVCIVPPNISTECLYVWKVLQGNTMESVKPARDAEKH